MTKKDSNTKANILLNLQSDDLKTSRAAINKLRKEGELSDIPGIIAGIRIQKRDDIKKDIHNLLCDINIDGAQAFIMDGVSDKKNKSIMKDLLSICWESNLDFTEYLEVFTSAFINVDYEASIEAFTIIEKIFMDYDMPDQKLQKTVQIIRTSYPKLTDNKKQLALVLLDSLQNLPKKIID